MESTRDDFLQMSSAYITSDLTRAGLSSSMLGHFVFLFLGFLGDVRASLQAAQRWERIGVAGDSGADRTATLREDRQREICDRLTQTRA